MSGERGKRIDYRRIDARIFDALAELMNTMSLDKISVKDIAATAGISRAAFYVHFEDKYAAMEKLEEQLIDELVELTSEFSMIDLSGCGEDEPYLPVVETYAWALRNRRYLAPLHSPNGDLSLVDRIKKILRPYFLAFVTSNGVQGKYVEPVYQAIAAMEEYRMLMYVSDANPLPPEEMGRVSGRMIRGLIEQFS